MSAIALEIENLLEARRRAWAAGEPTGAISLRLEAAYDTQRRERAAAEHGTSAEISSRARVERELERLSSV